MTEPVMARIRTERRYAVVLQLSDLEKLWKLLQDQIGVVGASASCSDEMIREFSTWRQLSSYDNPPTKEVVEFSIWARSEDLEMRADVHFPCRAWHTVAIDIQAREQVASEVRDGLSDILEGMKPWYSFLVRVSFEHLGLLAIMLYFAWCFTYGPCLEKLLEQSEASPQDSFRPFIIEILVSLGLFSILHFVSKALDRIWSWLFPRAYFALGQGQQRYRIVERVRWAMVGLGAASLLGAVL